MRTPVGTLQINSPLVGRQNVYNILAAVATGLATTVRGQPVPLKARAVVQRELACARKDHFFLQSSLVQACLRRHCL